ncbi:MAG TPA: hypothetical protein VGO47_05660 [Chlamydiales bacterium]|nr:hypothetical protein [Chlamydiales bacterium]
MTAHERCPLVGAAWLNIVDPSMSLNGEPIEVPASGVIGNLNSAWKEFAVGRSGTYATLEDAVKIRQLLEGIRTSAKEGRAIQL